MDKDFWLERWERGEIGFHQSDPHPLLQRYWPLLAESATSSEIFVPLCGKSVDMVWLSRQTTDVLGIDLSPRALEDFFAEQALHYILDDYRVFKRFAGAHITLLQGDLFDLSPSDLSRVGAVYDRAALIAMPPNLQQRYADHMLRLLPHRPPILLITLEYDAAKMTGPPFSTSTDSVQAYFAQHYRIDCLTTDDILSNHPNFRERGLISLVEKAYLLTAVAATP